MIIQAIDSGYVAFGAKKAPQIIMMTPTDTVVPSICNHLYEKKLAPK